MTILFSSLSVLLIIFLPVALAIALRRRYAVPWWLFCMGMITFAASQVYHIPVNEWLSDNGFIGRLSADEPLLWRTSIILGLSAGISETLARSIGYWFLFRNGIKSQDSEVNSRGWHGGIMIGLGHGGFEAMGFVGVITAATLSSLLALQGSDLSALNLPQEQTAAISRQLSDLAASPGIVFLPLYERAIAIVLHVILSLLVWVSFRRQKPLALVIAVGYHAAVDGMAVYTGQFIENAWQLEALLFAMLLPGLLWMWRQWPADTAKGTHRPRPISDHFRLLGASVRKELLQQWRTKRVLIFISVFLLFGLGSPLIAKFLPQMLQNMEGVEQFADLIPVPTNADALDQYIKNITQFGFIIAILIGMGSVAGEVESGTVAMILSKPLPRWSFLIGKFASQSLIFAVGFLLAALGAYYYTSILFDSFALGPFLFGNLLLMLWLMVFAAITLLGSTIARSTGAAAGIALIGSVLVLLVGSLPGIGPLFPAGLVAWASQLGLDAPAVVNGGAIAANVVIVLVCLIASLAVFETREL